MMFIPKVGSRISRAHGFSRSRARIGSYCAPFNARKLITRTGLGILALAGAGMAVLAHTQVTHAAPTDAMTYYVIDGPWYLHPGSITDTPTINSPVSDLMATGTPFEVQCVATGDPIDADGYVAGSGGDDAWEYGTDIATGNSGFVSDQGLSTTTTQGQEISELTGLGVPLCGYSPAVSSGYDGEGAAQWALMHAQDPQPNYNQDEDCTWFASQALILGGQLPQTSAFNLTDPYSRHLPTWLGGATGTSATWLAPDFINYVLTTYPDSTWQELDFSQNNQPEVQPGDIIAYDWNGDGSIDHLAVVVDDAPGTQYPEIAEWGNLQSGQTSATYQKTGWTWSAYYGNWIQAVYPDPHAYLLHIVVASF